MRDKCNVPKTMPGAELGSKLMLNIIDILLIPVVSNLRAENLEVVCSYCGLRLSVH